MVNIKLIYISSQVGHDSDYCLLIEQRPLPAMLFLMKAPFIFGWAKPVPVDFSSLKPRKFGTIMVALAGPAVNIFLAWLSAVLLHINGQVDTLGNEILLNYFQKIQKIHIHCKNIYSY